MKFTNKYQKLIKPDKSFADVTEDIVKKILYSKKRDKDYRIICRHDGLVVLWFRYNYVEEQITMSMESATDEKWFKTNEKVFSFSDEFENYNIYVAEYCSEARLSHEEEKWIEGMCNFHYGIKEDTGKYSIYDVYSDKELL